MNNKLMVFAIAVVLSIVVLIVSIQQCQYANVRVVKTVALTLTQEQKDIMEKTLAIIKPDAVKAGHSGSIIKHIETEGFHVAGMKKIQLTKAQAEQFYAVHKARPFFGELVEFMISGPVVVMALQKDNAILAWRTLMGATNPAQADAGTMRKLYGTSVGENATHGSDAIETAAQEVLFFFAGSELL